MAYVTPSTRSTGDIITAAIWNQDIVANMVAVKALADSIAVSIETSWRAALLTWTYASATTFTIPGDVTARFPKGTRIKLTQTTVKYFVVIAASYGSPNTTVTVTGGADYALADASITVPYYSYGSCPEGYPIWFNHTVVHVGFSVEPTDICRFRVDGNTVHFKYEVPNTNGTSNATDYTISAPIQSLAGDRDFRHVTGAAIDNGALTGPGVATLLEASSTIVLYRDVAGQPWTASGAKGAMFDLFYEF